MQVVDPITQVQMKSGKRKRVATITKKTGSKTTKKSPLYPISSIKEASGAHIFRLENMAAAKEHLAIEGYVVIRDILSPEQANTIREQLGKDFAGLGTGIPPDLQQEPTNTQLPSLFSKGICKDPNAGLHHSPSAWLAREAAETTFAGLYDVEAGGHALVSSFDGMTYFRHTRKYLTDAPWWHVDSNGNECIQGITLLTAATAYTGGLVVLPRSHLQLATTLEDIAAAGKSTKANYLPLDWTRPAMEKLFAECGGPCLVTAPANSISLWDSRLIHSNTHRLRDPVPGEKLLMDGGFCRLGFYTCMIPRNDSYTKHREELTKKGVMTNHWPGMEMRAQYLMYPRSKHSMPLTSVALPYETIVRKYGRFL